MSQEAFERDAQQIFGSGLGATPRRRREPLRRQKRSLGVVAAIGSLLLAGNMWWPSWDGRSTLQTPCSKHREFLSSPEVSDSLRRSSLKLLFQESRLNEAALRKASQEIGLVGDEARFYLRVLEEERSKGR